MQPRNRRTKAPRAAKDAQVEEQPESPCLPPHDHEEPTAPGKFQLSLNSLEIDLHSSDVTGR
ncbi:hypothetical protein DPMN_009946 [Dreissena polymorpha]|uniref:Uncharacterized protein n=1 Tax=Dreissena polymorpha TaxID=45954 RepID=A0A9D4N273_DREPO|nr:hypothetical protein DPMN_009946 [Dreissena polymorpha]